MSRVALSLSLALMSACTTPKYDVGECAGSADVEDTTVIVTEFKDSAHEMVTCGSLSLLLIRNLLLSAQTFMTDASALPGALTYEDGLYRASGTGVAMDLWLELPEGSSLGAAGETVTPNVFDGDSYFVNLSLEDNGDGTATMRFDSPGPLASLLGRGDAPESPLTVTDADAASLASNLSALRLSGLIYVDEALSHATVTYELSNPDGALSDMFSGQRVDMHGISASAAREDLGQTLSVTLWDVVYGDLAGTLEGTIEADVTGGPFDYHAQLAYSGLDSEPAITITCL